MSGLIVLAFAALLSQDPLQHPSTQATYQAPAIRPFEPGPDFGREQAQGDAEAEPHRPPLERPVTVETYARSYEYTPRDSETAYEQGVTAAEIRADQTAGRLDGVWLIVDTTGRTLYELALNDPGLGTVEGGWRGGSHAGSGAATLDGSTLTLEGAGTMTLERVGTGWRGELTVDGHARAARLIRPN